MQRLDIGDLADGVLIAPGEDIARTGVEIGCQKGLGLQLPCGIANQEPADRHGRPWLGRCRYLAKDFENITRTQLAYVKLVMIRLTTCRIARFSKTS
jgi:hypothetical protein